MKNAFVRDLTVHLDNRISTAVDDFYDRCEVVEIDCDRAATIIMTVLGFHISAVALGIKASEEEYMAMCKWHYNNMKSGGGCPMPMGVANARN